MLTRERQPGTRVWPINAYVLDRYITSRNPDIPISPEPLESFAQLFDKLRPLPQEIQQSLLTSFLVIEAGFPNGELLARFLAKINNIDWFNHDGTVNIPETQSVVDQHYQRLKTTTPHDVVITSSNKIFREIAQKDNDKPRHGFVDSYDASNAVWSAIRNTKGITIGTVDAARYMAFGAVSKNAAKKLEEITGTRNWEYLAAFAGWDAQRTVSWIILEQEMPNYGRRPDVKYDKGNPWEVLFDGIWDKGLAFIESYKLEPIIFVPPAKAA